MTPEHPRPTVAESHLTEGEHATFAQTARQLQGCRNHDGRGSSTAESPNQLNLLAAAQQQLANGLALPGLTLPTAEDEARAMDEGKEMAEAEDAHVALMADVESGNDQLAVATAPSQTHPIFEAMRAEVETTWPDPFDAASKSALLAHLTHEESIYLERTTMPAMIEAVEIPRAVQTMVREKLAVVVKVHASKPDSTLRGASFPLDGQIKAELAEKDQQVADLKESGQDASVIELQRQKREVLVDHLKDVKGVVTQHDCALQQVREARAAALEVMSDTIGPALAGCGATLGAFLAGIQDQNQATHTKKAELERVHAQNSARSARAQERLAAECGRAMADARALTSGSTGLDLLAIIDGAVKAATRQAEASTNSEKLRQTTAGYGAAMLQAVADTEGLQAKQVDAIETVKLLRGASVDLGAVFTKAAGALDRTSGHWETMVQQSRTRVRTTLEQLVYTLYMWIKVEMLTPAMKKEALTGQQVRIKQHALDDEKECVDLDDPAALHAAVAAVAHAKELHGHQVARVAAARSELDAVVADYDYKELRRVLTAAGVKINPDPSAEPEPDVSGILERSKRRLVQFLALGA